MQTRLPLKKGTIVSSNNRDYQIVKVIGDGATSIVYEAFYIDGQNNPHSILLKECYPFSSEIFRENTNLIWKNQSQYIKDIALFNDAYSKIIQFQNQNDIANGLSTAFDIFTQNNTTYIVFDKSFAKTFDKIDVKDIGLKTTLEIVLQLSNIVAKYHEYGYLHLDIKPSNFLVILKPNLFVKLFDIDTVILKDAVIQSSVVSYSEGYAAPEQLLKQKDKLSEATDIFAIGAVLFEKIISRTVSNADLSPFATWEYTNFEDNLNPRIFRLLTRFFHKTLCANVKKRYQNIRELINDLNEIISIVVSGEPYIISNIYAPTNSFIGREKELKEMFSLFNSKTRTIFIHGFGGIGKSELAKKYANVYSNNYDAITFINYKDSLEDSIKNIQLANYEGDITLSCLKKICSKNKVLIIVDNFDVSVDADNLLEELQEVSCDFIFTTRTDFSECLTDNQQQINLSSLEIEELYSLFVKEAKLKTISAEDNLKIRDLLKLTSYHTLTAILLAKQIEKSGIGVNEILIQYQRGLDALLQEEKIVIKKDNRINKTSPLQMLRNTFRISNLSQDQKNVLEYLHLFDYEELTKEKIRTLMRAFNNCINCLNNLVELGWVEVNNGILSTTYSLHPLIGELVKIEVCPNPECNTLLMHEIDIHTPQEFLEETLDDIYYDDAVENRKTLVKCEYLSALFYSLLKKGYVDFVAKKLCQIFNGNFWTLEFFDINESTFFNSYFYKLKILLKEFAKNSSFTLETQFYLTNILEMLAIDETRWARKKDEEIEGIKALKYLISLFYEGMDIIDKIETSDKTPLLWLLCKPMIQRIKDFVYDYQYDYFKPVVKSIQNLEHLFDIEDEFWDVNFNEEKAEYYFDGILTPEEDEEEIEEPDIFEEIEIKTKEMFWSGKNIKDISEYITKQDILLWRKIASYWDIANDFIHKLSQSGNMVQVRKDIAQLPWQRLSELLNYEEQIWLNLDNVDDKFLQIHHYECNAYRAICYAYLEGRSKNFEEYMQQILKTFKNKFEESSKKEAYYRYRFYHFDDIREFHPERCIAEIFDGLRRIEKQHLAFPYLIECAKIVENGVDENMLPWYTTIVEFASNSYFAPDEEQDKLFDIEMEYQNKIDKIVKPNKLKPISDD